MTKLEKYAHKYLYYKLKEIALDIYKYGQENKNAEMYVSKQEFAVIKKDYIDLFNQEGFNEFINYCNRNTRLKNISYVLENL